MNTGDRRRSTHKVRIPRDFHEEIGSTENIVRLAKVGLLSLKKTVLEREITDLTRRIGDFEEKITELPQEIDRFQQLLENAIKDQETLENLLNEKR